MQYTKKTKKVRSGLEYTVILWYIYRMAAVEGNRSRFYAGRGKSGLHRAGSPFQSPGNAGYERRMLRTISRRKESATESKPPGQPGKGEKVG